ncbi:MAG TPA: RodZ domain-containing protein [Casimicrobiaceae bacterium]|nr:RodZ domain-containing protein [Casimicrobiaceae bacterium]
MTGSVGAEAGTAGAGSSSASAGATLKAAREAAGLSLDAVAQQLKLAPRQVQALEDDDYQHLPGRTFVRGFARNYARYVHLDPDTVLGLLPAAEAAPALERPTLAPTRRPMGELPVERIARRSALRWLIPLLLLGVVVAAGYYEYTRQQAALRAGAGAPAPMAPAKETAATPAPASAPAPGPNVAPPRDETPAAAPATAPAPGTLSTPLPNPLAGATAAGGAVAGAPAATATATPGPTQSPQPAASAAQEAGTTAGGTPSPGAGEAPLVLAFKGRSWVEVRDASGRVVLQSTEDAGAIRTVAGTPPLQLALGNAAQVDVTFRGHPVDLGPYTRGNVARLSLK